MNNSKKEIILKVVMDVLKTLLLSVITIVSAVMICVYCIVSVLIIIPACACVKTFDGKSLAENYASTVENVYNLVESFINRLL